MLRLTSARLPQTATFQLRWRPAATCWNSFFHEVFACMHWEFRRISSCLQPLGLPGWLQFFSCPDLSRPCSERSAPKQQMPARFHRPAGTTGSFCRLSIDWSRACKLPAEQFWDSLCTGGNLMAALQPSAAVYDFRQLFDWPGMAFRPLLVSLRCVNA